MTQSIFKTGHKTGKRILAVVLALGILITGCGASGSDSGNVPASKWIDSDIIGYVTADSNIRLQDDYAAAANKELLTDENAVPIMKKLSYDIFDRKRAILENGSLQDEGLTEVRKYAALAEDWDYRNSQGVEPLRKYIESIEAVSSLDEFYTWMCDTDTNPLAQGLITIKEVERSQVDPTSYMTYLTHGSLSLGDANNYFTMSDAILGTKMAIDDIVTYTMSRLGYDSSDINSILKNNYQMEKIMAGNIAPESKDDYRDTSYSRADLEEASGNYPLTKYLDERNFQDTERFYMDISYVRQLDRMCDSNLEGLKSYVIVHYILQCGSYLDKEAVDTYNELNQPRTLAGTKRYEEEKKSKEKKKTDVGSQRDNDKLLFDNYIEAAPILNAYLNRAYVNNYVDSNCKDRLYDMTETILETYRTIFNNEDWLSEEGKAACIEKLNEISIHIAYPDDDTLNLYGLYIVPKEDGGNFLDAALTASVAYDKRRGELSTLPYDRKYWDPYNTQFNTTTMNAYYAPTTNGIYILAGIINDPVYYEGISDEELYGYLGIVVGHEFTHGFDEGGVRYNKDGLELEWMPYKDAAAFTDKVGKVAKFYGTLSPFPGAILYDGFKVNREATADMGGMRVTLKVAENIPKFDYDKYFRSFAAFFSAKNTLEEEVELYEYDEHPLGFLRINITLQQFDEFYNTYDVQPGDGMYLEEKQRIAVW